MRRIGGKLFGLGLHFPRWECFTAIAFFLCIIGISNGGVSTAREEGLTPPAGPPPSFPARTDFGKRVGIVYVDATANNFFKKFIYSQLFMAMQQQAIMAGIPFELLDLDDLTNFDKLANCDALLFPYALNVPRDKARTISDALYAAVAQYRLGLITAGDFLSVDEKDTPVEAKPYQTIRKLFGLQKTANRENVAIKAYAEAVGHPVLRDYQPKELIYESPKDSVVVYAPLNGQPATVLVKMKIGRSTVPAVMATEKFGRNVHFANTQLLGACNLVWPALQWVIYGDQVPVGLKVTRQRSLFAARNDMDQSRFLREVQRVEAPLYQLIQDWKTHYNFLGSFFLNIGNNPAAGERTDWSISAPLYQKYLALGNEIGTHSYTHPNEVNRLTPAQIEFEFKASKEEIERGLGIQVHGAAIPGMGEKLKVDEQLNQYFSYVSGRYGNIGSGYPGSIGFLNPDFQMLYFCHNLQSDFGLVEFGRLTAAQARAYWVDEYQRLMRHASQPILHWLWHDYGPLAGATFGYNLAMYEETVRMAFDDYTEFATMLDVENRIRNFQKARIMVGPGEEELVVQVAGNDLGQFCLAIHTPKTIASVDNWYAYNEDSVFLPREGGVFTIHLAAAPAPLTHILYLPMRAMLLSTSGNGRDLSFQIDGEGEVGVALGGPPGTLADQSGADAAFQEGTLLRLRFETRGLHNATVTLR